MISVRDADGGITPGVERSGTPGPPQAMRQAREVGDSELETDHYGVSGMKTCYARAFARVAGYG